MGCQYPVDVQGGAVPRLPRPVLEIIDAQPRLAGSPFVFSGTQQGRPSWLSERPKQSGLPAFNSFSQHKRLLDEKLPDDTPPWVLHDLRRTARSLMSRLAVPRDIAERTIGHTIPGVEGIYDRHSYFEEKSEVLKQLANLVGVVIAGSGSSNVVPIKPRRGASA